jgi:hypothetical protein
MVKFFVRTVATGFALSLGAAIYKKVSKKLGLDDNDAKTKEVNQQDGATDPGLH